MMEDIEVLSDYQALTIAINPRTYVTINTKRAKWGLHLNGDQKDYLDRVLTKIEQANDLVNYSFELTKAKNIHLHVTLFVVDQVKLEAERTAFLLSIDKKMQEVFKTRTWKQKSIYDLDSWNAYVDKTKQSNPSLSRSGTETRSEASIAESRPSGASSQDAGYYSDPEFKMPRKKLF